METVIALLLLNGCLNTKNVVSIKNKKTLNHSLIPRYQFKFPLCPKQSQIVLIRLFPFVLNNVLSLAYLDLFIYCITKNYSELTSALRI